MADRYIARSTSDHTDDWPFWFVADSNRGGLNVTAELIRQHFDPTHQGATLTMRLDAQEIAAKANEAANVPD
jgi:hypothetical protein